MELIHKHIYDTFDIQTTRHCHAYSVGFQSRVYIMNVLRILLIVP